MVGNGWYQIAFERELNRDVNPATLGDRSLVVVRFAESTRVFDAVCPHRGAHLGMGGTLEGAALVCPFHGYRIGMGHACGSEFAVKEHDALALGGLVFVRLSTGHDHGFIDLMHKLDADHFFVPGFSMPVAAPASLVIENAFDDAHFHPVHGIHNEPHFRARPSRCGEFSVEGTFEIPPSAWQKAEPGRSVVSVPFTASAYSPGLVVSRLGGDHPYWVLTAATPVSPASCIVRLSLIVPPTPQGGAPAADLCQYLLRQSKAGLEKDRGIWENLVPPARPRWTTRDAGTQAFREFCATFEEVAT